MLNKTCSHCRFWDRDLAMPELGQCRRYPPTPSTIEDDEDVTAYFQVVHDWPATAHNDYCGEFMSRVLPSVYPAPALAN